MIAVAITAAGMIVAVIAQTALGLAFSSLFISLSGGWLLLTLIMVMIVDTFLGTGIPTTPSYILTVVVGGAAMMKLGVGLLPAHLFAFYFGVLADITPPVAIAAYASAAIAGSEPMKTGFEAFKLAIGGFIVPFIFVYHPALILQGAWHETLWIFVLASVCIILTSAALTGWFLGPDPLARADPSSGSRRPASSRPRDSGRGCRRGRRLRHLARCAGTAVGSSPEATRRP